MLVGGISVYPASRLTSMLGAFPLVHETETECDGRRLARTGQADRAQWETPHLTVAVGCPLFAVYASRCFRASETQFQLGKRALTASVNKDQIPLSRLGRRYKFRYTGQMKA